MRLLLMQDILPISFSVFFFNCVSTKRGPHNDRKLFYLSLSPTLVRYTVYLKEHKTYRENAVH